MLNVQHVKAQWSQQKIVTCKVDDMGGETAFEREIGAAEHSGSIFTPSGEERSIA
jgi:hypothetical protein